MTAIVGGDVTPNRASALVLRDFEISSCSALAVGDPPAVARRAEARRRRRTRHRRRCVARVRGCAHPVVEDARGRLGAEIQGPAVEEPLRVRYALRLELAAQGLELRRRSRGSRTRAAYRRRRVAWVVAHRSLLGNLWDPAGADTGHQHSATKPGSRPAADDAASRFSAPEEGGQAAYDVSAPPATRLPNARWGLG